jgi:hypothetical protein
MRTFLHRTKQRASAMSWKRYVYGLAFLACFLGAQSAKAGAMSGTYTICSSGCNYSTIAAAVADLKANGISASVTFKLSGQDYNEPIRLNFAITGASSTKTVNFVGTSAYGSTPTRVYTTQDTVVVLNGTSYVRFAGIYFQNTATTASSSSATMYGVYSNNSNYIRFIKCRIGVQASTASIYSGTYGVYKTGGSTNFAFDGTRITGGYEGYYNNNSSSATTNDSFMNGAITNAYYYGWYQYYGQKDYFYNSRIDSMINVNSGYGGYAYYWKNSVMDKATVNGNYYALYTYYLTSCTISNSNITMNYQGSSTSMYGYALYLYYANGATLQNNTIKNNMTPPVGSSYAYNYSYVLYNYYATNVVESGNTIGSYMNNNVSSYMYDYGYVVYNYYTNGLEMKNNSIYHTQVSAGGSGTYYNYGYTIYELFSTAFNFHENYIYSQAYYVFMLEYPNYSSTSNPYNLINNMIANEGLYGYGIYFYNSSSSTSMNVHMVHNTFYYNKSGTLYYGMYAYLNTSHGYDIRNNNWYSNTSASSGLVYFSAPLDGTLDKFSGNNLYAPGGNLLTMGSSFTSAAAIQSGLASQNLGQHTWGIKTLFKNAPTDLHYSNSNTTMPWGNYAGVAIDFDGDARCKIAPTSGADEFSSSAGKPTSSWTQYPNSSVTYYDGYPATFKNNNKATDPLVFRWYVNGKKVSDSVDLVTQKLTAPSATVTLVTEGCGGKDSVTKTYTVNSPTKKPITDFISNFNTVLQGGSVKFNDLSLNYPSKWSWEVFPKTALVGGKKIKTYTYIGSDSTSANPQIQFNAPGKYQICLTTSNSVGTGNTECKVAYINVIGAFLANGTQTITDPTGYLYDDGGPNGPYSSYGTSQTTIQPACADKIYLVFTDFDLVCAYGTVLHIYDAATTKNEISKCATGMTGGPTYPYTCTSPATCVPVLAGKPTTDTFVATSGAMTITMNNQYNGYYYGRGFAASWWTQLKPTSPPKASFTAPDTVCTNANVAFTNTSTGSNLTYQWYFQGDLRNPDDVQKNSSWPFLFTGPQTIYLVTTNCGGTDTAVKTIYVKNPPKPKANFHADNTNPTTSDVVYLLPDITACVDDYKWTITKKYGASKVTFMNGTNIYSAVPAIVLSDTGCYDVKLVVDNASGTDSIFKACHIFVKNPYCVPTVLNQISDLGISNVTVSSTGQTAAILFSNNSNQTATYENYTPTVSASMEIGVSYAVSVSRQTSANAQVRTIYIDWNQDGDFLDAGETVASDAPGRKATWTDTLTVPAYAKTGATVMRIAANQGSQTNDPCQNLYGEYEDYRLYISNDKTPPVITLKGADTIRIEQGYTFTDPGATAYDNLSGDLTLKITVDKFDVTRNKPGFNILVPGTYRFTYNVSDDAGNAAKPRTRIVIVTPDKTKPDLEVNSDSVVIVGVNTSFTYPDATATDLVDGILDASILVDTVPGRGHFYNPPVNINKVDTFPVTYEVSDISGNLATKTIMVVVADTTKPVLTINGAATMYIDGGSAYTEQGVTYADNYYNKNNHYPVGGMTADDWMKAHIIISGNVNTHKLGTYTVTYTLCDPSGNCATPVVRTVIVQDTTAPVVTIVGGNVVNVEVNTHYDDPGVTAKDNFYGTTTTDVTGSFYSTFTDGTPTKLGKYTIVYTVRDSSGNTTIVTRTINVVDDIAPTVALRVDQVLNVCRWSTTGFKNWANFISASDNFYATNTLSVIPKGSFVADSTQIPGVYTLYYSVTDGSGNVTNSSTIIVNVRSEKDFYCTTGINNGSELSKAITIYPNPSTGLFTVNTNLSSSKTARIVVTNMLGQDVATVNNQAMGQGQFNLDLRSQAAGVYLVNIYTENEVVVKRIVISK